jgi:hypothetical protein
LKYIAFLKATPGTNKDLPVKQSKVKALYAKMKNETSDVRTINVDTTDGENLIQAPVVTNWKFTTPEFINAKHFESDDVKSEIAKLEKYLQKKNDSMSALLHKDVTNFEAATISLTSVKTTMRSEAKGYKQAVNDKITNGYKLPIKQQLLDKFIRNVKPRLQDRDVEPDEDLGMEGIVVLDPKTQKQFKIVDKDLFTTLNKFNYEVRNNIRGVVRSDDEEAPLDLRGGLLGTAKIRIAQLFDMPGLGKGYTTKKVLGKFKGENAEATVANIANSLKDADHRAFIGKVKAIIEHSQKELQETLDNFKENYTDYKVKLDNGKTVGYTKEIVRRTLLVFAETRKTLERIEERVAQAKSMADVVVALFGKQIKALFGELPQDDEDSLTEDDAGTGAGDVCGTTPSTPGVMAAGTTSMSIASVPKRLFKGKMIKRVSQTAVKIKKPKKNKYAINQ